MPEGMTIKVDAKGLIEIHDLLGRFMTKLPKAMSSDVRTVAYDYAFEMATEISVQNLKWKGGLFDSIVVEEKEEGTLEIPVPRYGFYLDKMEPHFVSIFSGEIKEWIESERSRIRGGGGPRKKGFIFVRPHPWIEKSFERARNRLDERLENGEFDRTFSSEGSK